MNRRLGYLTEHKINVTITSPVDAIVNKLVVELIQKK